MSLPLPPVKGGAVENLIDMFLQRNESTHRFDITVYSIYDENAVIAAKEYQYTKFRYIKIQSLIDRISRIVRHLVNSLPGIDIGNTYITKICRQLKGQWEQFDAIILENAPAFVLKMPKEVNGKLILHLHNDFLNNDTKNSKKIFDRFNRIFTISNTLKKCVDTIRLTDKVVTLYNGIDLERFDERLYNRNEVKKSLGMSKDDIVIMYTGRLVSEKGVYELISAFNLLKGFDNVRLLIVGGTGYSEFGENEYLKKLKSISSPNVIYTGYIPYEDIVKLYTAADIGVAPSLCNDAFNLSVIEYFSIGVPVIISDMGAMKELVDETCSIVIKADNHFVINMSLALRELLMDEKKRKQMGLCAKRISEKYSKEKYCSNFEKLLQEFIINEHDS